MSNKITCQSCSLALASFEEFIEHLYNQHDANDSAGGDQATHRCPFCVGDAFATGSELAMHCFYMHEPANRPDPAGPASGSTSAADDECYACPLCDFVATRPELVEDHVNQSHYEAGPGASTAVNGAACPVCARVYTDNELLAVHVNEHFEEGSVVRNHPSTSRGEGSGLKRHGMSSFDRYFCYKVFCF